MKVNWKEFRKNNPQDYRICCSKIYYKCKCKKVIGYKEENKMG